MPKTKPGHLGDTEPHPAALDAQDWLKSQSPEELMTWREAFASCALEGNRLAEVCNETLTRLLTGQPVSDRYVLGLAWAMRSSNWPSTKPKTRKKKA